MTEKVNSFLNQFVGNSIYPWTSDGDVQFLRLIFHQFMQEIYENNLKNSISIKMKLTVLHFKVDASREISFYPEDLRNL
jgi:hypothetical protein